MLKKQLNPLLLVMLLALIASASTSIAQNQKYAYVDTEYVLENIPEYTDAQDELNELSKKWQKEIEAKYAEVEEMYKKYQAEQVLLPEDLKRKRQDEIIKKEQEAKDLQRTYFATEGELFKKRQELVSPIQEKIYNAIETIATTNNYSFIFDKAGGMTLLYVNPKYDISDDVLDEVGNVMQTVQRDQRQKNN